jgi:hypothetical protein
MTYQISYDDGPSGASVGGCEAGTRRMEEYRTEREALGRVRELLEAGEHDGVSVRDSAGNVLCGVRLQLKLGFPVE